MTSNKYTAHEIKQMCLILLKAKQDKDPRYNTFILSLFMTKLMPVKVIEAFIDRMARQ